MIKENHGELYLSVVPRSPGCGKTDTTIQWQVHFLVYSSFNILKAIWGSSLTPDDTLRRLQTYLTDHHHFYMPSKLLIFFFRFSTTASDIKSRSKKYGSEKLLTAETDSKL